MGPGQPLRGFRDDMMVYRFAQTPKTSTPDPMLVRLDLAGNADFHGPAFLKNVPKLAAIQGRSVNPGRRPPCLRD